MALRRGMLRQALVGAAAIGAAALARSPAMPPVTTGIRFPFAVAVFAGSTFALWFKP